MNAKRIRGEKSHENVIPLRDGQQPLFRAKIDFLNGKKEEKVFGANFPVALKRQMQIVSIEYYGGKYFGNCRVIYSLTLFNFYGKNTNKKTENCDEEGMKIRLIRRPWRDKI